MIQSQITWHIENQENQAHSQEKREWTTSDPEMKQMLKLTDKNVKAAILTILDKTKAKYVPKVCKHRKTEIVKQ